MRDCRISGLPGKRSAQPCAPWSFGGSRCSGRRGPGGGVPHCNVDSGHQHPVGPEREAGDGAGHRAGLARSRRQRRRETGAGPGGTAASRTGGEGPGVGLPCVVFGPGLARWPGNKRVNGLGWAAADACLWNGPGHQRPPTPPPGIRPACRLWLWLQRLGCGGQRWWQLGLRRQRRRWWPARGRWGPRATGAAATAGLVTRPAACRAHNRLAARVHCILLAGKEAEEGTAPKANSPRKRSRLRLSCRCSTSAPCGVGCGGRAPGIPLGVSPGVRSAAKRAAAGLRDPDLQGG
mmetsp:Transcript_120162/g.335230  ORF Transcript_120162/g.335230 Transcript_120162/m.335230 type:complete len:292 (+) Transcript_120162:672-1547(+)